MDMEVVAELHEVIRSLAADETVKALYRVGKKSFVVGGI